MSIRDAIIGCVESGTLVHLRPREADTPRLRTVLVSDELYEFLSCEHDAENDRIAAIQLWAGFDVFTSGDVFTFAEKPVKKDQASLVAPLLPLKDDVFQFRISDNPKVRVAGGFSEPDTFVALTWNYRSELGNLENGVETRAWRALRESAKAKWANRLNGYRRLTGGPNDLATNIRLG